MGLFIGFQTKYVMILGSEVICTKECSTGQGKVVHGEDSQWYHDQAGCMPPYGEDIQVGCHFQGPSFPYQAVKLSNNQV